MEETIEIPLYGRKGLGLFATIDAADFQIVSPFKWYSQNGYAVTVKHRPGSGRASTSRSMNISMHRLLLDAGSGDIVDHASRDRLDNRRSNIRLVTASQNSLNRTAAPGASGFIGVVRDPRDGRYAAMVCETYYGSYLDARTAAMVRDRVMRIIRPGADFPANFNFDDLPGDLKIVNLNTSPRTASQRSSVPGVSWVSSGQNRKRRWRVIVGRRTLGYFLTEDEAVSFLEARQ